MAAPASSARRSSRASQQPLSLAEEQAAHTLSRMEERDLAAALRLSLNDDWDSDEEKSGANDDADMASDGSDDEEEAAPPAPAEVEAEWSRSTAATLGSHAIPAAVPLLASASHGGVRWTH